MNSQQASQTKPEIVTPTKLPAVTNPRGVSSVYVNHAEFLVSSLDVRILFNEIIPDQGQLSVERRANIVMSVEHFRSFIGAMNAGVAQLAKQQAAIIGGKSENQKAE